MGLFDELAVVEELLAPRPCGLMIDVGASVGVALNPYLKRNWRVIAVEPDTSKFAKLQHLKAPGLELVQAAVGRVDHPEAAFYKSAESATLASIIPFHPSHTLAAKVPVITLTTLVQARKITAIDFLKIDANGLDFPILQNFPFRQIKPDVIMVEFDEQKTAGVDYDDRTTGDLLTRNGYQVWLSECHPMRSVKSPRRWRKIEKYPCELTEATGWGNYIAVRSELAGSLEIVILNHLIRRDTPAA